MMASLTNSQEMPPGRELLKVQECDNLNKTIRDPSNTALVEWVNSIEGTGFIKFNIEKMQNSGDLAGAESVLGLSSPNSFVVTGESVSPANPDVTFVTTQQYYNGILVVGGGYTQGLINCATFFMSAFIMEDINIGLTPSMTKQQAITLVQSHELDGAVFLSPNAEDDLELVIDRDLSVSCGYVLAWKAEYVVGSVAKTTFINTSTGTVYREDSKKWNLNAPTVDYGTPALDDTPNPAGTLTLLRNSTNTIRTFDKSTTNNNGLFGTTGQSKFPPSLLPTTSATDEWPTGGSNPEREVYQAHHVTTNAHGALSGLGLTFPSPIFVAGHVNINNNAGYFVDVITPSGGGAPFSEDVVWYGRNGSKSFALLDIAGHELTHAFLGSSFSGAGENGGIAEAICDIFGELVENETIGSNDWVIGGDNGLNLRQMDNPTFGNYFAEIGEKDVHDSAGPMNRWFTIIVEGGVVTVNGISFILGSIDINSAAQIVLSSIDFMTSGSDYFDAREATIAAAELIYGECSDEAQDIAIAWYAVGVGELPQCELMVAGAREYCEENLGTSGGNVDLTLVNPIPGHTYKWTYPLDWHAIGESSPQTYIGTHLRMYEYGYMPNFPRFYTITLKEYDTNNVFQKYRPITVKIKDCDGDDPPHPCADEVDALIVNGNNGSNPDHNIQSLDAFEKVATVNGNYIVLSDIGDRQEYRYSVYDISGRTVSNGFLGNGFSTDELPHSGIYIFHVHDSQSKLVQVEKICHIK